MGARSSGGAKKAGLVPNINVTPLVDVVLVLLIIFMVVLPDVSDSGKPVDMVKVRKADKPITDAEILTVTIDRNELYTLGDDDMERPEALAALRESYGKDARQPVMLRGDSSLPYRVVRGFFADVQDIGFENISLAVGVSREWANDGQGD